MKFVDCYWELENIGKKTCEISFLRDELIKEATLHEICSEYEYVVVKTEIACMQNSIVLGNLGFSFVETQISIQKNTSKNIEEDAIINHYLKNSCLEQVITETRLNEVLSKITSNMFTTDRIYLDPNFGSESSLNRYRNWIKTEYLRNTSLYELKYKKNVVGFILCKHENDLTSALLGGIYEEYQNRGLGLLLPLVPYLLPTKVSWYKTKISSNNLPVWNLYERLRYEIKNFEYVFIKHNNL